MINGAKANDQYYASGRFVIIKGSSDISKAEKYTMILKKILNMQISAIFFFLSSCTNFIQMYFDIGDLCVKA